MTAAVEIVDLRKHFGPLVAVDGVSFSVDRGEILGFLGPNGAGKSTTMKMITGFLTPSGGSVSVCGHDVQAEPLAAQERLGYLPEGAPLYADMTPAAFLHFIAEIRGFRGAEKKRRVAEVVAKVHLEEVMHQPIDTLSKGFKRRVGLAQAILHDPEVLILDEPTDGLDPNQKHEVRTLIREMAEDKVIILSTHILEEVHAVCTRAIVIAHGRIVADGTPEELEAKSRFHNAVSLSVRGGDGAAVRRDLEAIEGVASVADKSASDGLRAFTIFPIGGRAIGAEIGRVARERQWEVVEFHTEEGRLDEVFRSLTTGTNAGLRSESSGGAAKKPKPPKKGSGAGGGGTKKKSAAPKASSNAGRSESGDEVEEAAAGRGAGGGGAQ